MKKYLNPMLVVVSLFVSSSMAAGGFASEAVSGITSVRDGIVLIVGVLASIALLWQLAEGFMSRKTWGDVMTTCLWIFGAGGAVAGAAYIFGIGQSISF